MAASPKHAARVLGLTGDVTLEDVKRVRRKMALKYHPDRCHDVDTATRHMSRINAAADTLIAFLKNKPKPSFRKPQPEPTKPRARQAETTKMDTPPPKTEKRAEQPKPSRTAPSVQPIKIDAAQRKLVERAAKSYQQVLSQIGQQSMRRSIDLKIMRFGEAA